MRVHLLEDSVARQIAAGEVIDRPYSIVRELLDNAIDAGAASIDLYVESGGVASVRVVDDGAGMTREDLELCWHSHATSKIDRIEDLDRLASLGFRGEALASIAASCRLTITSRMPEAATAFRLKVESGKLLSLAESPGERGTVVDAADLFYALPARRKFLRTPSAETAACRSTFIEKSLPFPQLAMRYLVARELKLYLPAVSTLEERVAAAHPTVVDPSLLHRVESRGEAYSLSVVIGGPSLYRRDRRYIWVYVNGRRINEYALTQAVEYGFADHIPGGNFPVAFVFVSIDPELVDFNVHPAKREVRFRNLPEIHHALVSALKGYLTRFTLRFDRAASPRAGGEQEQAGSADLRPTGAAGATEAAERSLPFAERPGAPRPPGPGGAAWRSGAGTGRPREQPGRSSERLPGSLEAMSGRLAPRPVASGSGDIRYFGQLFELFLIASVGERLFIIDQHAAHERILFERLRREPGAPQKLLVPIAFETTPDEDRLLEESRAFCDEVGISLERKSAGLWEISSLPEGFHALEDEIVSFVKQAKGTRRELEQELYARLSCRAAVKEGDRVDDITALELIKQTFALEIARCPHGRPIWYELSRSELYHLVGRL